MTKPVSNTSALYSKNAIRSKLRNKRRDISSRQRTLWDKAIRQHLLAFIESKSINSLAAFWPFDGEPDILPLYRQLLAGGTDIALPKIAAEGHIMEFHAWQLEKALTENRFGIPEPGDTEKIKLSECPLLLMPLVAYDHLGNRLGVGAGYYDRHLESMRTSPLPLRIGVAYSLQEAGPIESNNWDIPLHGVVNENGVFSFSR